MNVTPNPIPQAEPAGATRLPRGGAPHHPASAHRKRITSARIRNAVIIGLFAAAMFAPKVIHLRRNVRSWFAFRVSLGIAGAALVLLPLALWDSYMVSVVGLAMFLVAILLPSARPDTTAEEKVRELGALVVVDGGEYQPGNAAAARVQLFAGVENIWALDRHFQPLLVIPVRELRSAIVERAAGVWLLRLQWADHAAEFSYRGVFGEHLVGLAGRAVQTVMRSEPPLIRPRSRAASA
jgi:hypothetical protein